MFVLTDHLLSWLFLGRNGMNSFKTKGVYIRRRVLQLPARRTASNGGEIC